MALPADSSLESYSHAMRAMTMRMRTTGQTSRFQRTQSPFLIHAHSFTLTVDQASRQVHPTTHPRSGQLGGVQVLSTDGSEWQPPDLAGI